MNPGTFEERTARLFPFTDLTRPLKTATVGDAIVLAALARDTRDPAGADLALTIAEWLAGLRPRGDIDKVEAGEPVGPADDIPTCSRASCGDWLSPIRKDGRIDGWGRCMGCGGGRRRRSPRQAAVTAALPFHRATTLYFSADRLKS